MPDSSRVAHLSPRFEEALVLAARHHAGQLRKGTGIPYLSHLLAVASLVLEHGGDEDEAIAALLHDAVEDGEDPAAVKADIERRFGPAVAAIVAGCSDSDTRPRPPWRARKERYLEGLGGASPSVRLVSAADKLHNARSILSDHRMVGERVWGRFTGGREGTLWYYRALARAFLEHGPQALAAELYRVVSELERRAGTP